MTDFTRPLAVAQTPPTSNDQKLAATGACFAACAASHLSCVLTTTFNIFGSGATGFANSLALSATLATASSAALYGTWYAWWATTKNPAILNAHERRDIPRAMAVMTGMSTAAGVGFMALPISAAACVAALGMLATDVNIIKNAYNHATPLRKTLTKLGVAFTIATGALGANIASKVPVDVLRNAYHLTNVPNMSLADKYTLAADYITVSCATVPTTKDKSFLLEK